MLQSSLIVLYSGKKMVFDSLVFGLSEPPFGFG